MNTPVQGSIPQPIPPSALYDDEDSINLLELLDVVLDQRWLIVTVTALVLLLGGAYAFLTTPIYEANTLIQVEESKGNPMGNMLGEVGGLFDIRTPTAAEIEILRSRLVVGQAVANLQLDLEVNPKYLPVIGRWLAHRATEPSSPGFLGLDGYVTGNESLQVAAMEVPTEKEGDPYVVALTDQGYELRSSEGEVLGQGKQNIPLNFSDEGNAGSLLITGAVGKPGAEFHLTRFSRLEVTERLQQALQIAEQGRQSGVMLASLEGKDPALIARILNEIGALYVRQNTDRKAAEAEKSINFLNTLLPQLRKELESSESKFNQFRNRQGTFDLGNEAKVFLDQTVALRVKLLDLQQKRKELEARFTPQHPSIQALDAQIRDVSAQIDSLDSRTKNLPNVEQDLLRLTRDVKVNNELYTNLLDSAQQLRLVKEGKVGNVRVVDVAAVPELPVKPKRSMVGLLSGVLGLLAGVGLAFLRNSLHPGIKEASEIEQHLGLNVFATVPFSVAQAALAANIKERRPGQHLLTLQKPDDPSVESLRSLRTALQFGMLDAANNIVVITGPTPSVGKSFLSANFAAVLAAGGKRVLLVDADMRKGHIHQYFDDERGLGLTELIAGTQPLEQVLRRSVAPDLDLITTGTLPPNPGELLMSPATVQLLQTLSVQYDIVLVDTPPVLAVSDTQVLAPHVGTVFMVTRSEVSSLGEVQESAKRLGQSGVAVRGVIFNGLNITKRRYGYGVGYKYGYRYTHYKY